MKVYHIFLYMFISILILDFNLISEAHANVADNLNINYNKIVNDCGSPTRPAFLCSGNLIRFSSTSRHYHTWDPSPFSINSGGVSFTYLRSDISVSPGFQGKTSGIIYYPSQQKPAWKGRSEILCVFPADGWTGDRPTACGSNNYYPDTSSSCQSQGIVTVDQWYQNFMSITDANTSRFKHQCGFDMSIGSSDTAQIFNENLKAINQIYPMSMVADQNKYNEVIIKTWPTIDGKIQNAEQLPIQAFFYKDNGLVDAQYFQQDYYDVTGIWIPIVKMNSDQNGRNISFAYNSNDQIIAGCSN